MRPPLVRDRRLSTTETPDPPVMRGGDQQALFETHELAGQQWHLRPMFGRAEPGMVHHGAEAVDRMVRDRFNGVENDAFAGQLDWQPPAKGSEAWKARAVRTMNESVSVAGTDRGRLPELDHRGGGEHVRALSKPDPHEPHANLSADDLTVTHHELTGGWPKYTGEEVTPEQAGERLARDSNSKFVTVARDPQGQDVARASWTSGHRSTGDPKDPNVEYAAVRPEYQKRGYTGALFGPMNQAFHRAGMTGRLHTEAYTDEGHQAFHEARGVPTTAEINGNDLGYFADEYEDDY